METWQLVLMVLGLAWLGQGIGTWMQMRHFREVMGGITQTFPQGFVGAGNARGSLGKGVIMIIVVDDQSIIRRLAIMEGRSVFAKFKVLNTFDGQPLDALKSPDAFDPAQKGRAEACARAIEQIEKARSKSTPDITLEPAVA